MMLMDLIRGSFEFDFVTDAFPIRNFSQFMHKQHSFSDQLRLSVIIH